MSGRKQPTRRKPGRFGSRQLAFEQLTARMVLSAGAYGVALGLAPHDVVAILGEVGRDLRGPEIGPSHFGGMPGGMFAPRGDWGGPPRASGFGPDPFHGGFAPPIFATSTWMPPTVWIVVVEMPGAVRVSQESHDPLPLRAQVSGLPPGGVAPMVTSSPSVEASAPTFSASADNTPSAPSASPLAPLWFASTTDTQAGTQIATLSSGSPSSPNAQVEQLQRNDNAPAKGNLLVPDASRSGEGGLIELEGEQPSTRSDESRPTQKRSKEELAALGRAWSELGRVLKTANETLAKANAARRSTAAPQSVAAVQPEQARSGEGGMIELAVDARVEVLRAPLPRIIAPVETELAIEAGVALFQAFELGTLPTVDSVGESGAAAPGGPAQESAAADDTSDALGERAAFAGAALAVLPFAIRTKRTEEEARKAMRGSRVLNWFHRNAPR